MEELGICPVCHEDTAYFEHEGDWCVYVQCSECGTQTAFCSYESEEEKAEAEAKAAMLWNMGKVIAERRSE